jgi:phage terminase large subunit-like protein
MFARQLSENGLWVKKISTNRSKLERFRPFSSMAQNGGIQFVSNCGTDFENKFYDDLSFVYKELENFTGERKKGESGHDDIVDACSDAFYVLASSRENIGNIGKQLTSFTQDMRVSNPFK